MKKAKKRRYAFILFFTFMQGFFLSSFIGFGVYEIKISPVLKEQHKQINTLKNYINYIQKHLNSQKNSRGEKILWQQI